MAESDECLTCSVCLETLNNPHLLQCFHSFCYDCLLEISKNKDVVLCPCCRAPTDVGNWKKDIRGQELLDYIEKYKLQKSIDLKSCIECKCNINDDEIQLCKECCGMVCIKCTVLHNKSENTKSHTIYSLISNKPLICNTHNKNLELFCKEIGCTSAICESCAVSDHQGHSTCTINDQAEAYLTEMSKMVENNEIEIKKYEETISFFNNLKSELHKHMKDIETLLNESRDAVMVIVNEVYHKQFKILHRKYDDIFETYETEINELLEVKADYEKMKNLFTRLSSKPTDFEILHYFQSFQIESNYEKDLTQFKLECTKPTQGDSFKLKTGVLSFIGHFDLRSLALQFDFNQYYR